MKEAAEPEQTRRNWSFLAAEAEMECDSSTASSLIVPCSPWNAPKCASWENNACCSNGNDRKSLNKPAVASHATKASSGPQLRIYKAADLRRLASVAGRTARRRRQQRLWLSPRLQEPQQGVICVWKVCVVGLRDESWGGISGESGTGGAAVSDLASVRVIQCEAMEGSAVCSDGNTPPVRTVCQHSLIKMSCYKQKTQIITCPYDECAD